MRKSYIIVIRSNNVNRPPVKSMALVYFFICLTIHMYTCIHASLYTFTGSVKSLHYALQRSTYRGV